MGVIFINEVFVVEFDDTLYKCVGTSNNFVGYLKIEAYALFSVEAYTWPLLGKPANQQTAFSFLQHSSLLASYNIVCPLLLIIIL